MCLSQSTKHTSKFVCKKHIIWKKMHAYRKVTTFICKVSIPNCTKYSNLFSKKHYNKDVQQLLQISRQEKQMTMFFLLSKIRPQSLDEFTSERDYPAVHYYLFI